MCWLCIDVRAGVAYGRLKQVQADAASKLLCKRALTCLGSSSSQVAQQAGETVGVLLAQMKRAGDSSAESASISLEGLRLGARDALREGLSDPGCQGRCQHEQT